MRVMYVLEVVDIIVFMCASKVPGMVKKAKLKANYVFLLDGRVDLNDRGTLMELVERLYFHRDHLLSMFNLDPLEVGVSFGDTHGARRSGGHRMRSVQK
jgi:hypothetical protein